MFKEKADNAGEAMIDAMVKIAQKHNLEAGEFAFVAVTVAASVVSTAAGTSNAKDAMLVATRQMLDMALVADKMG